MAMLNTEESRPVAQRQRLMAGVQEEIGRRCVRVAKFTRMLNTAVSTAVNADSVTAVQVPIFTSVAVCSLIFCHWQKGEWLLAADSWMHLTSTSKCLPAGLQPMR